MAISTGLIFSIYGGQARWRSESIQIGGLNSARGCLGHWFDKDYDDHGPAGPTAFWKISDNIEVQDEDNDQQESEDEMFFNTILTHEVLSQMAGITHF